MDKDRCLRCGRVLRSAISIASKYGRRCLSLIRAAARLVNLADYQAAQIERAHEVIEQGGILPTRRPTLWTVVSGDGTTTYLVALQGCTCQAGIRQRRCYHRAAAAILNAARPARRGRPTGRTPGDGRRPAVALSAGRPTTPSVPVRRKRAVR